MTEEETERRRVIAYAGVRLDENNHIVSAFYDMDRGNIATYRNVKRFKDSHVGSLFTVPTDVNGNVRALDLADAMYYGRLTPGALYEYSWQEESERAWSKYNDIQQEKRVSKDRSKHISRLLFFIHEEYQKISDFDEKAKFIAICIHSITDGDINGK